MIEELRQQAASHQFGVYAFCVMPDHLHALVRGLQATSDLLAFMKILKRKTGYEFQSKFRRSLWQKKFHDHILRPKESPEGVAADIWMNPVRKGLCKDAREYPYSGSFLVDWRNVTPPAEPWAPSWKSDAPA
jgi:putative transposase